MGVENSSNHLERETLRGRIDSQDFPALYVVIVLAELYVLTWLELSAVIEAHRSREKHDVALLNASIEEGLSGPGPLDHAAVVLQHRLEDPETAAGGDYALGDHLPDDRSVHACLE